MSVDSHLDLLSKLPDPTKQNLIRPSQDQELAHSHALPPLCRRDGWLVPPVWVPSVDVLARPGLLRLFRQAVLEPVRLLGRAVEVEIDPGSQTEDPAEVVGVVVTARGEREIETGVLVFAVVGLVGDDLRMRVMGDVQEDSQRNVGTSRVTAQEDVFGRKASFAEDVAQGLDALLQLGRIDGMGGQSVRDKEHGEVVAGSMQALDEIPAEIEIEVVGAERETASFCRELLV